MCMGPLASVGERPGIISTTLLPQSPRDVTVTSQTPYSHSSSFQECQSLGCPCSPGQSRSRSSSPRQHIPLTRDAPGSGLGLATRKAQHQFPLANPRSPCLKHSHGLCRHCGRYFLCPSCTGLKHLALQSTNTSGGVQVSRRRPGPQHPVHRHTVTGGPWLSRRLLLQSTEACWHRECRREQLFLGCPTLESHVPQPMWLSPSHGDRVGDQVGWGEPIAPRAWLPAALCPCCPVPSLAGQVMASPQQPLQGHR